MECTLAALVACFSWSGFYVDTGIAYADAGERVYVRYVADVLDKESGELIIGAREQQKYDLSPRNPFGRFSLGYEINVSRFRVSLEGSHISSLDTGKDRGVNYINLNVRWFPFKRQ
jgi:hypothetical protein